MLAQIVDSIPMKRLLTDEIANAVMFLCSPRAGYITGSTISISELLSSLGSPMDLLKSAFATLKQVKHMAVSLSERALTRADITNNLSKLDIPDDAIVFIHSGFKSIGEVDGGPGGGWCTY